MSSKFLIEKIRRRGLLLVLSSPSGAGKTTIARGLRNRDKNLIMSISATTRKKRPGEEEGKDYFFTDQLSFDEMVEKNEFLEFATVFGESYGSPRVLVEKSLNQSQDVIFDVDWQGSQQLKKSVGDDLVSIFILPPSLKELERRLFLRAQDPEETVRARMANAVAEMQHWSEYDYVVTNHNLEKCIAEVQAILTAERLKKCRCLGLGALMKSLKTLS